MKEVLSEYLVTLNIPEYFLQSGLSQIQTLLLQNPHSNTEWHCKIQKNEISVVVWFVNNLHAVKSVTVHYSTLIVFAVNSVAYVTDGIKFCLVNCLADFLARV